MRHFYAAIILAVFVLGCTQQIVELDGVEVREYEGEDLSSINDFRENSIKGTQYIDLENYTLQIKGLVDDPQNLTYEEIIDRQIYSKVVTLYCVEGWSAKIFWEGILIIDLFDQVGVRPEADTVIFRAYDGYSTSLPLDYLVDNRIILAHRMNNVTIPPERGFPFQLVAESKWGYKWIKWITEIELSDDSDYLGYWERRGYSNEAELG
jgi:DMSO/TMAO reductase YedYZ molybdopterin-dependent catalytic subunit